MVKAKSKMCPIRIDFLRLIFVPKFTQSDFELKMNVFSEMELGFYNSTKMGPKARAKFGQ